MNITLKIPQIEVLTKKLEVSKKDHDKLLYDSGLFEKCNFIWDNMTEQEKGKIQDIATLRRLLLDYPANFGIC